MDRASGSGVFARDPDAMIDMIELELPCSVIDQEINKAVCATCRKFLEAYVTDRDWENELSQDNLLMAQKVVEYCRNAIGNTDWKSDIFEKQIAETEAAIAALEAQQAEIEQQLALPENQTQEMFQKYESIKHQIEQKLYEWEILSEA